MQKIALFSKASFLILRKTWFLNYLLHQMFLLNLKSHATMLILSLRTYVLKNFLKYFLKKILNTLKSLDTSKGTGIDNLSQKFPKDGSDILARPISQLCDLSIKLNSFPRSCKIARVKLLFKIGSKTNPGNYRPISLLPTLLKNIPWPNKRVFEQK